MGKYGNHGPGPALVRRGRRSRTGGGRLGGSLLRAGLVDEVDVDLLPALIGGRGTPAPFDAPPLSPGETPVDLDLMAAEITAGGRLRLRYSVRRPDDGVPLTDPDPGRFRFALLCLSSAPSIGPWTR